MPAKIVFIGAGSLGFTRTLVRDCLTFPTMRDAHIVLVDIDAERLRMAKASCAHIISAGKYPARLTAAVLSLAEIRDMVNAMFAKNKPHLPQFKHFKA